MAGNEELYKESMSQGHSAAWDQNWEEAAKYFRTALDEFPERKQALTSLGLAFYEMQRYDEALKCYTRAAELAPNDPMPVEKSAQIFERNGNVKLAADRSMEAAELYLQIKDVEKALENWTRVTSLIPEHLKAHARLALVHERLGRTQQAVREYISVAALLQDIGQIEEALKTVERATKVDPGNQEAKHAFELVKANKTLPKPKKADDAATRMAAVKEMEKMPPGAEDIKRESPDPIAEARQAALTALAEILFDVSDDDLDEQKAERRGLRFMMPAGQGGPDFNKISKHIGRAIDLQTRARDEEAAKHLERAIKEGLDYPPAYFSLGLLQHRIEKEDEAQPNLKRAMKHPDYSMAARLLVGQYERTRGKYNLAVEHYLEALKQADCAISDPALAAGLQIAYEPLIETHVQEEDEAKLIQLLDNIEDLILRTNWRKRVMDARQQLPASMTGRLAIPLAEILTQAKSTEMVDVIANINELARRGFLRSAMEEAYIILQQAPTYLPLHIHMGELLLKQERTHDAITKFTMVAQAYSSRGEAGRSTDLLRRIVEIAPLDLRARTNLIDQLVSQGQAENAIDEYINLADVHYRLAELDRARKTYQEALTLAQKTNVGRVWGVRILSQMADIDMQRLDWRQALLVLAQLRSLDPNDQKTRRSLVDLNIRLGQSKQAEAELDNYLSYLSGEARDAEVIDFMKEIVEESPEVSFTRRRLAQAYQQAGQADEALKQWDQVAETLVEAGDNEGAKEVIRAILMLNPPNADQYRTMLQRL